MPSSALATSRPTRARLWTEFALLFGGVPIVMAVYFGQYPLFGVLLGLAVVAAVLLAMTPGFSAKELWQGPLLGKWRLILHFALAMAAVTLAVAWALVPERLLAMPRYRPELWLLIVVLYPIFSAAPQELIFRTLFFRRYGPLFPNDGVAVFVNALAFGFGHLFYMNWVTIGLTTIGGAVFALAYLQYRSYLLAVVLHGIAGQMIFTSGLGIFFYHGAIGHTP